jgi:hypothetical protein
MSDVQLRLLDELLRTDSEFRKFYLAYMDLHAQLASDVALIGDPLLTEQRLRSLGTSQDSSQEESDTGAPCEFALELTGGIHRSPRSWEPWAALTAAAVLVVGLALWLRPSATREGRVVKPPGPVIAAPSLATRSGFAVVMHLEGTVWEGDDERGLAVGDILAARRLNLRSGHLTLGLLSGVTVTLEGPADLDLVALDRVHCRSGKLRARVPEGAEGFVVSTPGTAVIDRGTEFGLNVASDGTAQVMVFQGEAEAAVLNASGMPLRSQQIEEHHAFDLDPRSGQIDEAAAHSEDFVAPPVLFAPGLRLHPSYADEVMRVKPRGYWRFDSIADGSVANEVRDAAPFRVTGTVRLSAAVSGNRSVEFGPEGTEQYLVMDGLWEPPCDPGYAIELWVLPERIGHAALASLVQPGLPKDDYKHLSLIELTASDRQSMLPPGSPPASVRFLHRWPAADWGGDNLFSSKYYIPYRWHHLVAQRNGGRMELYMDGEPTFPVPLRRDVGTEPCRLILGRLKPEPRLPGRVHSRPFIGRIDELALYDHPLSAEDIRRHYSLGNPEPGSPDL